MTTSTEPKVQVSVRLSAAVVRHIDALVADGKAESRAAYLDRLAAEDRRRESIEREIAILTAARDDPDELAELAAWSARQPRPELD